MTQLEGIHHVTAIVEDPQENVDFYTQVLGLRLVKRTVNFDDPYTYHLYYGDEQGQPGTIITFFPWPDGRRGSRGNGQISAIAFGVPAGALAFWQARLANFSWNFSAPEARFGADTLSLYDPSGLLLELVEQPYTERPAATNSDVPAAAAIQQLFGVTLTVARAEATAAFLTEQLGFTPVAKAPARFQLGDGTHAAVVDLISRPDMPRGRIAAGSVHHVAWRVADDTVLAQWQQELARNGAGVTEIRERQYFRSIYFREPSGVLFEIATDPPGFTVDEPIAALGQRLMLPPWLESQRTDIEKHLLPITVAGAAPAKTIQEETPVMSASTLSFVHQFVPAPSTGAPTLLLLHGTGGDEHDLLDLGRALHPTAALLSPRGQVLENGMPRFFRRLAEGVFDLEDLRKRTQDLAAFVAEASAQYGFDPARVIAVGYSNGANIAASLLLTRPEVLAGAVLFHAMVPFVPEQLPSLPNAPIFMGAGRADQLIPTSQTEQLAQMFQQAGANVELHWENGGHALNRGELAAATAWMRQRNAL